MKKFTPGMIRRTANDILPLARRFLRQVIEDSADLDFASDVQELLVTRDYPGNITHPLGRRGLNKEFAACLEPRE